jgi:hypothetical protein
MTLFSEPESFSEVQDDDALTLSISLRSKALKRQIEEQVHRRCRALTLGQRCADWFVLRQFRVTGTNASSILLKRNVSRSCLGLGCGQNCDNSRFSEEESPRALLETLAKSWFSSSRSTEEMMRGTANEGSVIRSLSGKSFIAAILEIGMIASKENAWLACSPDAFCLIRLRDIEFDHSASVQLTEQEREEHSVPFEGEDLYLACVEIKTSVAESALRVRGVHATSDVRTCTIGDEDCRRLIPECHIGQVLMQALVLECLYAVYNSACETGILLLLLSSVRYMCDLFARMNSSVPQKMPCHGRTKIRLYFPALHQVIRSNS